LSHSSQAQPLYESVLIFDERRGSGQSNLPKAVQQEGPPAQRESVADFVEISRGPDGFIQVWLSKQFAIDGDVTAELSMNGVVEIMTLESQHKVVPKSTSIEYRAGELVQVQLLGTSHSLTTRLP
jgi:hypothetical protein